jgi:hypothetical protein
MIRITAEAGHRPAGARPVELPAMVVALDAAFDHAAGRQRRVPVRASIQQRDTLSIRVTKCNQG